MENRTSFTPQISIIHYYSKGTVGANLDDTATQETAKPLLNRTIEVKLDEVSKFGMGEITDNVQGVVAKGEDGLGRPYESESKVTTTIRAKWKSFGNSNRLTAPNVRRGESVMVWRVGDSNTYYWDTFDNDIAKRRLETVILAISAEPDINIDAAIESDNCYYIQMSSHLGSVLMRTSQANGELAGWTVQLNGRDGNLMATDQLNNRFLIDTTLNRLELISADLTQFLIDGKDMYIVVQGDLYETVKGKVIRSHEGDAIQTVKGDNTVKSDGEMNVRGDAGVNIKSPSGITESAPGIAMNGDISSNGSGEFGGTGRAHFKGDVLIEGRLDVEGSVRVEGDVDAYTYTYRSGTQPW